MPLLLIFKTIRFLIQKNFCYILLLFIKRQICFLKSRFFKKKLNLFPAYYSNFNLFLLKGIITPYRKQVIKMRNHMRDMDLEECKVATIEEFQGDERRVIIVSMVRASQQYLNHDLKFSLGFVHNQKRFNVAISRAMSLLICIGDPNLLSRDKCWEQFINYCLENESYNGCKFRDYKSGVVLKRSQFNG